MFKKFKHFIFFYCKPMAYYFEITLPNNKLRRFLINQGFTLEQSNQIVKFIMWNSTDEIIEVITRKW